MNRVVPREQARRGHRTVSCCLKPASAPTAAPTMWCLSRRLRATIGQAARKINMHLFSSARGFANS